MDNLDTSRQRDRLDALVRADYLFPMQSEIGQGTALQEPLLVGLDCSTHGAKAIAWSASGVPVAQTSVPFELRNPRPGWWEQDARSWLASTREALACIGSQVGDRIKAIGITHQRETFVGVDDNLCPVRPAIVWMDERSHEDVARLRDEVGDDTFLQITGKPLNLTPSISKIHWMRRVEPQAFHRVCRWLDVQAWLIRHLTGEDVTSIGSADPMGLVNLREQKWSEELLRAVGISKDEMPHFVKSGTKVGNLLDDKAALPRGIPVVVTAGDGQVAAVGAGIRTLSRAYMNLGTAIVAGTVSDCFVTDRAFRTMSGAQSGTYLLESDLKGGTFTLDWLFQRILAEHMTVDRVEQQAASLPPGAGGLILLPYFATVMNPYWDDDASGVLFGLRADHGPAHLFRAILEGIAMEERLHLDCIEKATGVSIEAIHVLGGGASSNLWCQILADTLERPVLTTHSQETTSLGAAMLAGIAIGMWPDLDQATQAMTRTDKTYEPGPHREVYAQLYSEVFVGLYPALQGAMRRLARFMKQSEK